MNMQENQLKLMLQSAIVKELEQLKDKFSFWGTNLPGHPQTLWESHSQQTKLTQLLPRINEQVFIEADNELKALCGIGWEFIWGLPTPEFVTRQKRLIREISSQENGLSDLENFWLTISAIDTDYF